MHAIITLGYHPTEGKQICQPEEFNPSILQALLEQVQSAYRNVDSGNTGE